MSALEEFKSSNAWDNRYDLPLVPSKGNPWFYAAVALKILEPQITKEQKYELGNEFYQHSFSCEVNSIPGLYRAWPDNPTKQMSHDELLGMGYIDRLFSESIVKYLEDHFGRYNSVNPDDKSFRFWMYRFPMTIGYLKVRAGRKSFLWNLLYAGSLLLDTLTHKEGDEEGRLRIWLTLDTMNERLSWVTNLWKRKMEAKGLNPKSCLAISFADVPVYSKWAPEKF